MIYNNHGARPSIDSGHRLFPSMARYWTRMFDFFDREQASWGIDEALKVAQRAQNDERGDAVVEPWDWSAAHTVFVIAAL